MHYRQFNIALQAIDEYNDLNKVKECLLKFKKSRAKYITDCIPGFTRSTIEIKSLITNHYFVTVKDNKYIITEKPAYNLTYRNKFSEWIYWSEDTFTQSIIVVYGDELAADFIDNDLNFKNNIAKLINIADDWTIIEQTKSITIELSFNNN